MSAKFDNVLRLIRANDKNNSVRIINQDNFNPEIFDVISDSRDVKAGTLFANDGSILFQ